MSYSIRCARCHSELSAEEAAEAHCPRCLLLLGMGEEADSSAASWNLTGERLGQYEIRELLGGGGMGTVYAALDTRLGRTIALKVLPPEMAADPERLERFRREARAVAALDHPGIVTIHSIEEADGLHFLTMERVEGKTLGETIPEGGLPSDRLLRLATGLAEALRAAHERGVVHRDLKPSNVMVDGDGRPKLVDFGLARSNGGDDEPAPDLSLTQHGQIMGTIPYMAPEQLQGHRADARSDQFSLGVLMYEMASGRRPFSGATAASIGAAILKDEPPPLETVRPGLGPALSAVVERCLDKHPDRRFPDLGTLVEALHRAGPSDDERADAPGSRGFDAPPPPRSGALPGPFTAPAGAVGREPELERLSAWLDQSLAGERRIVLVTGESGIGKSALVASFLARLDDEAWSGRRFWLAHGQCLERGGQGEAYMPVLEALGRAGRGEDGAELVALLSRLAPTWLTQMPALVPHGELEALERRTLGATQERMLREMVETLDALSRRRPVLLVLEDLHWSDYSTLDLVAALAHRPDPARLLVVATLRRQDFEDRSHPLPHLARDLRSRTGGRCVELALEPLSAEDVAEYLARRFPGSEMPDGLADLLHQRTEGHPLFMVTVVDSWISRGLATEEDGRWSVRMDLDALCSEVPETLRLMIGRRLEELDADDRTLLEVAAVAGGRFSAALVAAALRQPVEETESRSDALARHGRFLLARGTEEWPDGTVSARFGFGHHLVQEVLYKEIPPARRARIHLTMGERLEQGCGGGLGARAAELAVHFSHGRDGARAVRFLRLAAEHALGRSAHREAIDLLDEALDLLPRLGEDGERRRAELALQPLLASALIAVEGWTSPAAERAYLRALELCDELGDERQRSRVLYGLATMRELRGQYRESATLLEERLCLPVDDPENAESLESHELLACSTFHLGQFSRSLDHAEHGLRLFSPERHRSLLAQENLGVSCHDWAALSLWFLGFPDRAVGEAGKALALANELAHPYTQAHAHNQAAIVHQLRREVEPTRREAERTLDLGREYGFPYRIATAEMLLGWVTATTAAAEDAEAGIERLRSGLETCRAMGAVLDAPYFEALLAEALHHAGRTEEALAAVDRGLGSAGGPRECFFEAELHRLRGRFLLEGDRRDAGRARACFERAVEVARRQKALSLELRAALDLAGLAPGDGEIGRRAWLQVADLYHGFGEGLETADLRAAHSALEAMGHGA